MIRLYRVRYVWGNSDLVRSDQVRNDQVRNDRVRNGRGL